MWALDDLKRSMGSIDFAAQFQQQPVPPGGNLIKWAWFNIYDKPPIRDVGDHTIVSWDTAMSAGELSDYSACVIVHRKGDDAYILDVVCERLDYPDRGLATFVNRASCCCHPFPFRSSSLDAVCPHTRSPPPREGNTTRVRTWTEPLPGCPHHAR